MDLGAGPWCFGYYPAGQANHRRSFVAVKDEVVSIRRRKGGGTSKGVRRISANTPSQRNSSRAPNAGGRDDKENSAGMAVALAASPSTRLHHPAQNMYVPSNSSSGIGSAGFSAALMVWRVVARVSVRESGWDWSGCGWCGRGNTSAVQYLVHGRPRPSTKP